MRVVPGLEFNMTEIFVMAAQRVKISFSLNVRPKGLLTVGLGNTTSVTRVIAI